MNTTQLTIKDGDLLVIKITEVVPNSIYEDVCRYTAEYVKKEYPNNKFIVLDHKTELTVIKAENTRKHKPFKDKIRKVAK